MLQQKLSEPEYPIEKKESLKKLKTFDMLVQTDIDYQQQELLYKKDKEIQVLNQLVEIKNIDINNKNDKIFQLESEQRKQNGKISQQQSQLDD